VKDRAGVIVAGIEDGSPATEAGMQPGGVIVQVDRQAVQNAGRWRCAIESTRAAEPVLLHVHRGDTMFVPIERGGKPQG
jgi:S1-C subfamily serine protease